jgi:hypothetical protein
MLPEDRLRHAIDIQQRSYRLLKWVSQAIDKGFIPPTRAHEYAHLADAALDWMEQHYLNFPEDARPLRGDLPEFAKFFSTYVTTSFDVTVEPGDRVKGHLGCYCHWCRYVGSAPHLETKRVSKAHKAGAVRLMEHRVAALAREEGIDVSAERATAVVHEAATRRFAAYSAYGDSLIRRLRGHSDGTSVLALWREIAWKREGSPIRGFELRYEDFAEAEVALVEALRSGH